MAPRLRNFWERQWKGLVRWWHDLGRRMPERLWLWWVLSGLVLSRALNDARYSVRKVAIEPVPRDMHHFIQKMSLYPGWGENEYRRSEAELWAMLHGKEEADIPVSHRRHLLVEIAYLALKERGR